MSFPDKHLKTLIGAGYPIIYLLSRDESYVENSLRALGNEIYGEQFRMISWDSFSKFEDENPADDPTGSIHKVLSNSENGFLLFKDLQFYIRMPRVIRQLKDFYNTYTGNSGKHLFIISSMLDLPQDLEKEITVVDIPLPDLEETRSILKRVLAKPQNSSISQSITEEQSDKCSNALLGLGASEMELALNRTFYDINEINEDTVNELLEEKSQLVRKSGTLEFLRSGIHIEDVGGLENLKTWLDTRSLAYSSRAREFGLDMPKGLLIMGISGCGKSLCAKAVATAWNLPLLRLDLNQVYGGSMGSPEDVFRRSIKTVEATAPCVLWIDEIEAGITRSGEKTSDTPASRIFGYFLTWMQEKTTPVFVAATANQIDLLPPEILRKGRFDEIFFVTLPNKQERRQIFEIHLKQRGKDPAKFDLDSLAKNSEGLSGAEIEQAVVAALFESFSKNKEIDDTELVIAASSIVPLSTTMREEISKLERWAADRATKASRN